MERLACDRCDLEYTDEESINMAKSFSEFWEEQCRSDKVEPRGITPCPNIGCHGELILKDGQ